MIILPSRLLTAIATAIEVQATWDTGGDPLEGFAYRWTVTMDVTSQSHCNPFTPTPNFYTAMDVQVGDWFSDLASGLSVQIVEIVSRNDTNLVAICEDIERYNTFTDPSQNGAGMNTNIGQQSYIFQLGDDGLPILAPMSPLATQLQGNIAWQMDQISRFRYRNLLHSYYRVNQPGHSFALGDTVYLKPDATYAKVNPTNASIVAAAGSVSSTGIPGADWFSFRPVGRVVTGLSPALPGLPGELIYLQQSGLSNAAPSRWSTPQYIQLETTTSGIALNRGADTAGSLGYVNRTYVVADQTAANATLAVSNPGDQIAVDNAGLGEWSHYLVHTNQLRVMATQDSARVDAESLEVMITPLTPLQNVVVNGVTMSGLLMGNVSAHRSITLVNVQVTAAFSTNAVVSIGTTIAADLIMPNALIDLTVPGAYAYTPSIEFTSGYTTIYALVNYANSVAGNATLTVSYV